MKSTLHRVFGWCAFLTLLTAPTQLTLINNPRLGVADILLVISAALCGIDLILSRRWHRALALLPHWSNLLFVLCATLSVSVAADRTEALKEVAQLVLYFVVGGVVFKAFLSEIGVRTKSTTPTAKGLRLTHRTVFAGLGAVLAVVLGLALWQYLAPGSGGARLFIEPKAYDIIVNALGGEESPLLVCGTFGNCNVLGGYLTLALPFCMALLMLPQQRWWVRTICALLLLLGLTVVLSGAAYWALALTLTILAARRGLRWLLPTLLLLTLWQCEVLPRLPRENDLRHYSSVALYSGAGTPTRRYPEWQAAYNMIVTRPWLGVGLGNYQKQVGQYYAQIPNATGPNEPDTQNLFLVMAAAAGVPTLLALVVLLVGGVVSAARSGKPGVAGALAAFSATAIWHPLIVRGIGLPLVFVLVLAQMERCVAREVHEKEVE